MNEERGEKRLPRDVIQTISVFFRVEKTEWSGRCAEASASFSMSAVPWLPVIDGTSLGRGEARAVVNVASFFSVSTAASVLIGSGTTPAFSSFWVRFLFASLVMIDVFLIFQLNDFPVQIVWIETGTWAHVRSNKTFRKLSQIPYRVFCSNWICKGR